MPEDASAVDHAPDEPHGGLFAQWHRSPLYLRIIAALVLGLIAGVLLGERAHWLDMPSNLILRLLGALAPALILLAVIQALMNADLRGRGTLRLIGLLVLNTLVAILIGLTVANVIRPGGHARLEPPGKKQAVEPSEDSKRVLGIMTRFGFKPSVTLGSPAEVANRLRKARASRKLSLEDAAAQAGIEPGRLGAVEVAREKVTEEELVALSGVYGVDAGELVLPEPDHLALFLDSVPRSLLGPLGDNGKVIGVIFVAVAFGIALRRFKDHAVRTVGDLVQVGFASMLVVLHWIIDLVPLGVFGIVASIIGTRGFAPFAALGSFILAVLIALLLQCAYYLIRVRFASWVRPGDLVRGCRDALVMAFSTASSTITMPVTYSCLKDRVGLREESASMGALVGANFNNDGTALYEAMSALFVAQMLGMNLSFEQQFFVVITSVVASVGAAGIPEAGLVTMTLVFTAVGLPPTYIALLLTVDWFLDRCRTAINVMGDMNVSCILDGKRAPEAIPAPV